MSIISDQNLFKIGLVTTFSAGLFGALAYLKCKKLSNDNRISVKAQKTFKHCDSLKMAGEANEKGDSLSRTAHINVKRTLIVDDSGEGSKKSSSAKEGVSKDDLEKDSEQASLNGRKVVYLPIAAHYQSQWKEIGITWIEPLNKKTVLARALLPEGWETRDNPSPYSDHSDITLLDNDHIPRVNMFIKDSFYDSFAYVRNFLTKEEGKLQLQKEIEEANIQKKKEEDIKILKELIISKRSEIWSQECSFGVFFIKDMSEFSHGKRRSCHGFFPTEEIAIKAKEFLTETGRGCDLVFTQKLDNSILPSYKIVNGFINGNWWKSISWE